MMKMSKCCMRTHICLETGFYEEMGGQYKGVDRTTAERYLEEAGSREEWRGLVAKIPVAPRRSMTIYGIGEGEGEYGFRITFS